MPRESSPDEKLLVRLFNEKKGKLGIRRLKMRYERLTGEIINLKKIVRIKKKFELVTTIRKANKYRASFKAGEEHRVAPNLLNRNFKPIKDEILLSTDITELKFSTGQKAYLSAVQNLETNEVMNFRISPSPTIHFVTDGFHELLSKLTKVQRTKVIIHSDQGFHYTSHAFRKLLNDFGVKQSMSRKGNCLDNAPIESFFGHMKDEVEYKTCKNFKELKKKIQRYIYYYNNERPQWGLKQKTPAEAGVKH